MRPSPRSPSWFWPLAVAAIYLGLVLSYDFVEWSFDEKMRLEAGDPVRAAALELAREKAEEVAASAPAVQRLPLAGSRREAEQHYLSGVIYFQKGDRVRARSEWGKALGEDPGHAEARRALERLESSAGGS